MTTGASQGGAHPVSMIYKRVASLFTGSPANRRFRSGVHQAQKLHLGSGSIHLDGWLNIDIDSPHADLNLDLRCPLPCADDSVKFIFSEHFIEHITRRESVQLLRECRRILVPGGVLRLSTPDLKWIVEKYLEENLTAWGDLWRPATPCQMMNEGLRSWGHQFVYDTDELKSALTEAGFTALEWVQWRRSRHPELDDLEQRPFNRELIAEATK